MAVPKRAHLVSAVLLAGLVLFVAVASFHYPIRTWLAWRYLWVGALAAVWGASCWSFGYFVLDRLRIEPEPETPAAVLAFPLGVFAFETAIFVLGLAHLLGAVTFVLLPVAFLAAGRRRLRAALTLGWNSLRELRGSTFQLAVVVFGLAGIGLVYFQILSPEVFHWDARWYHLPLAQQFALEGAVRPSPVGWWLDGYPHAASFAYAWGFLLPASVLFDRLELCVHMEMVVFLATLASVPALVRALVPGVRAAGTWVVFFLFPAIFLFDGNLSGEADHFAALFAIPLALATIRLWQSWRRNDAVLFGVFVAAILSSKYSAWSTAIFPCALVALRAVWLGIRRREARALVHPLMAAATALLLSGQHWLKNWLWYGDPLFPILHKHLAVHPWSPESPASFDLFVSFSALPAAGLRGLLEAVGAAFTFSFIPNDWWEFHHNVPIFGSLFTLLMACLPFVRASARLWLTNAGCLVAIVFWYMTNHRDRYLQAWLPCMVACTAAMLILVWNMHARAVRVLLVALVAVQIVWAGDVPFIPAQNLVGDSPIRYVAQFLASGFAKTPNRLRVYGDEGRVAEALPRDAVLLVHEIQTQVGFGSRIVPDQWQGRLSYGVLGAPAAIHRALSQLGVTHVVWEPNRISGWNSLGTDLAFAGYVTNYVQNARAFGAYTMGRVPASVPNLPFNDRVAVLLCGGPYADGIYPLRALTSPQPGASLPAPAQPVGDLAEAVRSAGFVVVNPTCHPTMPPELDALFQPPMTVLRGGARLYARRLPAR